MEVFKSEKISFANRWLSRNGLLESPWYKSCLYNKNDHKIQRQGGAFEADFALGARIFKSSGGGGVLDLWIDRRITIK